MSTTIKATHLSQEQLTAIAELLKEAQGMLEAAAHIVVRAPYTDETLRCQKHIQERLIDPLRELWIDKFQGSNYLENPFPSVGYWVK